MTYNSLVLFLTLYITFTVILVKSKSSSQDELLALLEQIKNDESVKVSQIEESIARLDALTTLKMGDRTQHKKYMAQILNEYAKGLFYGKFSKGDPDIQKAYYYFKLASTYGNSESLYYLSFYSAYHLDGKFLYENNYESLEKEEQHVYLKNYIKNMNATSLLTNSYISSLQGYNTSTYLMGSLYWNAKGVKTDCPSSVLYFKKLAEMLLVQDEINEHYSPELLEKKRLDELYFHEEESDTEVLFQDVPQELEYIAMSADLGRIPYILRLANTYYYGLRGEKRDLQKAFEYFYKAASLGDSTAKFNVGKMLVEGIGVSKDVETGLKYLREAAMKNNPKAQNILGKLYYIGEVVPKDEKLGIEYFKDAATLNYTDGQYNYGVTLLKNEKDKELALALINSAALQGHTLAMFHLGLLYLEGTDRYYSCEVGGSLLKTSCERGPWSRKLRDGYFAYTQKKFKLATIYYMEAALLGYDIAHSNAALLIDKYHVFRDKDVDLQSLKNEISSDTVWQALHNSKNYKPPYNNDELLNEDIVEILSTLKQNLEVLKKLTKLPESAGKKFNNFIMVELLRFGVEQYEPLSLLRLGDLYQEGRAIPQNYTEAYEYYATLVKHNLGQQNPAVLSHAYYNLAYMNHHALGREKNLTKAIHLYNVSLELDKSNYYLVTLNKKLAEWEMKYFEKYLGATDVNQGPVNLTITDILKLNINHFEERYSKSIILGFLGLAIFVLCLVRLRLANYIDIYLKGSHSNH